MQIAPSTAALVDAVAALVVPASASFAQRFLLIDRAEERAVLCRFLREGGELC